MKRPSFPISPRVEIGCAVFVLSLLLFAQGLGYPLLPYWDEKVYIPAARQLLQTGVNENWSHPLGGKLFIAIGMAFGGDNPWGWRIMSALFGALSVAGAYRLGLTLFATASGAFQCALLCLLNQMLFVQARIAMLDIFMVGFMMWGIAWFAAAWLDPRPGARAHRQYLLSAVCFGWSAGCKWFGLIPGLVCGALYLATEFRRSKRSPKKALVGAGVCLLAVAFGYALVLLPYLALRPPTDKGQIYGGFDLIRINFEMLAAQWQRDFPEHPFQSAWYTWIFPYQPIWFFHRMEVSSTGAALNRVIIDLGNPLIFAAGFLAQLECLRRAVLHRDRRAGLIAALYFAMVIFWGATGRSWTFNFYYLPASLLLAPALVYVSDQLGWQRARRWFHVAVALLFIYFYPVLSAQKLTQPELDRLIWIEKWNMPHAAD